MMDDKSVYRFRIDGVNYIVTVVNYGKLPAKSAENVSEEPVTDFTEANEIIAKIKSEL